MDTKRTYNYRIEPRDVDFMRRATLMALVDYLLHTAGEDADRNGFGVRDLNLNNASWVLTRLAVEIDRMPDEYEPVRVTTWVSNITRAMTTRNFDILDARGERIAGAVSNWAMIDLSSRRLLDLHQLAAYDTMTQDFPLPAALPHRLATPLEWLRSRRFARVEINYLQETRHGDVLALLAERSADDCLYEIRNARDEAACRIACHMV